MTWDWYNLYLFAGLCAALLLLWRTTHWIRHGRKLVEVGYVPPRPPIQARWLRCWLSRLLLFFMVGKLRIVGAQHLRHRGRLIILVNHIIEHDAVVLPAVLGCRHFRSLMAVNQITPLRAPLAALTGAIAVHHEKNPRAAVRAAIAALDAEEDSSLLVFPQGELHKDNVLERKHFFSGAMLITHKAAKNSDEPFAVLPIGMDYDRNPAHRPRWQKLLNAAGIPVRRFFGQTTSAVNVVVGEPIPLDKLPEGHDEAMTAVFERICTLTNQAKNGGRPLQAAAQAAVQKKGQT